MFNIVRKYPAQWLETDNIWRRTSFVIQENRLWGRVSDGNKIRIILWDGTLIFSVSQQKSIMIFNTMTWTIGTIGTYARVFYHINSREGRPAEFYHFVTYQTGRRSDGHTYNYLICPKTYFSHIFVWEVQIKRQYHTEHVNKILQIHGTYFILCIRLSILFIYYNFSLEKNREKTPHKSFGEIRFRAY